MIKLILLINIILVLNSTLLYIGFAAKGRCDRELYFNGCCPNTQWDSERDMCVDCPSGYYWINCSKPCQYPYYGSKCGQTCSCEEKNCDHMSGCESAPSSVKNAGLLTSTFGIGRICSSPNGCLNRVSQSSSPSIYDSNIFLKKYFIDQYTHINII